MSQRSIASFFGKPLPKKTDAETDKKSGKCEENRAKTKDRRNSGESRNNENDETKENCKNGVNTVGSKQPTLDAEGLPPLRKTAVNPAFKRNHSEESAEERLKKVAKKTETTPEQKPEISEEHEEKATNSDAEEESPIKKPKRKKHVIESDSEEEVESKNVKDDSPEKNNKGSPKKNNKADSPEKNGKEDSPEKNNKESNSEKREQKSISNFFTPKSDKSKIQSKVSKSETKPVPIISEPADDEAKTEKPKASFAGFFSPKPSGSASRNEGGLDYDRKVLKTFYHPIDDCFWAKDEPTPYLAFAKTLEAIEATSGRLKTIEILSNYFRSVMVQTPCDLLASVNMSLNRLAPAWYGIELGIGETLLIKAIANTTGRSVAHIKADANKLGDLGLVAEQSRGGQRTMFQPAPLTVQGVFSKLKEIANLTGHSSGNKKVEKIQALLVACRSSEARYLIRSLAGKLRIGLAEQSLLQALAHALVQTPIGQSYPPQEHTVYKSVESDKFKEVLGQQSLKLKTSYCECPSYDLVIPALLDVGIEGIGEKCKLTPGIPLKPMLAHPTKGVQEVLTRFENCRFTCEWKYDGERAQIHLHDDGKVNIFSRNQEDNTTKFPDIIARLKNCLGPNVKSAVLDCEAVAWDREKKSIQPFQILSTRKRKDAVEEEIKVQVCVFAFDLLYLNGESLVKKPFETRRGLLMEQFVAVEGEFQFAKSIDGNTVDEIQEALEESIKDNCEGLMVKTLDIDATYEIARRSHNWLKLKKDYLEGVGDTLDLVVIGGYLGKGKRTGKYGGFLLACYEPENEEYQSICKIGTGFTDEALATHADFFKDHITENPKSYYSFDPSLAPDHWFEPVQVWEVKCADLSISPVHRAATGIADPSRGVSLRFPRFIRIRDDKKVEDATNAEQIAEMYNSQDIIKNQNKDKKTSMEDDFDF